MSAREAWAPNGWRDPAGDPPDVRDEVLVQVEYPHPHGHRTVWIGWIGEHRVWLSRLSGRSEPIDDGIARVIGWQPMPATCATPASKSNDTTEARR